MEYCQPSEGIAQDSLAPKREKKQPELAELEATFSEALAEAGGTCLGLDELPSPLVATKAARSILASLGHELPLAPFGQHELDALPWLVATASWRVARTGSLWVDMEEAECRAQYLLPEGLILIVRKSEILYDLPEHYARLSLLSSVGSLVTGPSKTADIELSLVHGAHGPKSLIVVCYHESDS